MGASLTLLALTQKEPYKWPSAGAAFSKQSSSDGCTHFYAGTNHNLSVLRKSVAAVSGGD
jgi:hypothetical protein